MKPNIHPWQSLTTTGIPVVAFTKSEQVEKMTSLEIVRVLETAAVSIFFVVVALFLLRMLEYAKRTALALEGLRRDAQEARAADSPQPPASPISN